MLTGIQTRLSQIRRDRIVRSSITLMLAQGIAGLVGIVFWAMVSRNYAPSEVGQATTLIAVASAMTLLMTAGLAPALMLTVARAAKSSEASALAWVAASMSGALGALAGGLAGVVLSRVDGNLDFLGDGLTPAILAAITGASATGIVADAVATSLGRTWLVAVRALLFSTTKVVLLLILLESGMTPVESVGISWAVCGLTTSVLSAGWATGWTAPRNWADAVQTLRKGMSHHHASALGSGLPPLLIPVMVTGALGTTVSAQFSIAWMIAAVFFMISPAIAAATLAQGASHSEGLPHQLRIASALTMTLISVPVLLCVTMGGVLLNFFGAGYSVAAPLLALLAISAIPDAITNLAVTAERVRGRLRRATIINGAIGVVTVGSVWFLLPGLGLLAPGVGWLMGQVAGSVVVAGYVINARRAAIR